jgi:hypothetical protein
MQVGHPSATLLLATQLLSSLRPHDDAKPYLLRRTATLASFLASWGNARSFHLD